MFWIICTALAATVGLAIALPLLRSRGADENPAAAYDLRVYRDQLREVERDLERGVLDPADAERLRVEIGRKVLAADRALEREGTGRRSTGGLAALAILVLLLAGAFALYFGLGQPQRPDAPIALRIMDAQKMRADRPSQSEAEASAPKPQTAPPDAEYMALIERLRDAVAQNPDDPRGLELLAQHESRLGNTVAAKDAQARLVALRGDKASSGDWARLAALAVEAAGGVITDESDNALTRALQLDPKNPQARFMSGLSQIQAGRPDLAFPIWAGLLQESPPDAPWTTPIRASISDLAWFAGQPDYTPPDTGTGRPAMPGPDAGAMAAAQDMTPGERQQMIQGMVQKLEDRLAGQGGTPEEWARLIGALNVLGKTDHAREILTEARARFASDSAAMATVEAAAKDAGLE